MAQSFLLSAARRTLNVSAIEKMSDEMAFQEFHRLRWGSTGQQGCPRCGVIRAHYFIRTRKQWRCRDCSHTFSLTSGTIFAGTKLGHHRILRIAAKLAVGAKGVSAVELSATMNCQYKAAWVLLQKVRESLFKTSDRTPLEGTVHADGAYICYHVRPKNHHSKRVDRRLKRNQNPNKRCVQVFRQVATEKERFHGIVGATRTIVSIIEVENQTDITRLAQQYVKPGSVICCDENVAYDILHGQYDTRRINHQVEYSNPDGTSNNQAESFHARLRRMQLGVVHKFLGKHADLYATHVAFLEDTRRWDTKRIFEAILKRCFATPPSKDFSGYWQGNKRFVEILGA